jgi:AAA15 family ATPase/GTPase
MSDHFIKNIEITTYKCFDQFEASGFKRVNLIGGKNNMGKTILLEALYLNTQEAKQFVAAIRYISSKRFIDNSSKKISELYMDLLEANIDYKISSNNGDISFSKIEKKNIFLVDYVLEVKNQLFNQQNPILLNEPSTLKSISLGNLTHLNIDKKRPSFFLSPTKITAYELSLLYEKIQLNDLEEKITKYLNNFDKEIEQFKIFSGELIKLKKSGKYHGLGEFGDGTKAYIAMIIAIYNCENGFLMIDELENGIHYTQFDQLWRIILSASKEVNCQIFATTHSKECIDSYARIAKKRMDEEIAFIELGRNKKNELKAMVYPYEWFLDEIEQDHEVRGW